MLVKSFVLLLETDTNICVYTVNIMTVWPDSATLAYSLQHKGSSEQLQICCLFTVLLSQVVWISKL